MNDLDELAHREKLLRTQVLSFEGLMEEKSKQIEEAGIYRSYSDLYEHYVDIYRDEHNIEALKRALFLQWYAVSEPGCFTGLPSISPFGTTYGLNTQSQYNVLQFLNQCLEQSSLDDELSWMLQWYFQISEWYFEYYFEHFGELQHLQVYFQNIEKQLNLWKQAHLSAESMKNRGQMSDYWLSVIRRSSQKTS